jgi:DNA-binding transcriptional ArsR family regulator
MEEGFCCPLAMPQMADPSRRRIYEYLATHGEKTVGEVTALMKLRQPTVSYHLKEMKKEGLLSSRKEGRQVYYHVKMLCPEGGGCFGL